MDFFSRNRRVFLLRTGWTMVEILVTVFILAIVTRLAVSAYQDHYSTNQVLLAVEELSGVTQEVMMSLRTNSCPTSFLVSPDLQYIQSYNVTTTPTDTSGRRGCSINALVRMDASGPLKGKEIKLLVKNLGPYYDIECKSNIQSIYLPDSCTHDSSF